MPDTKEGKHYHWRSPDKKGWLEYWAEGGMIVIFDHIEAQKLPPDRLADAYTYVAPDEFERRAELLGEEGQKANLQYGDERDIRFKVSQEAKAAVREARAQGDFTKPEVSAYHARHAPTKTMVNGVDYIASPKSGLLIPRSNN